MKYLLLLPALILDTMQFLLGFVFMMMQFATPIGGGVAGALTAAGYCYATTPGAAAAIVKSVQCAFFGGAAGAGISAFAMPFGAVIDVSLSITVGAGILLLLGYEGMFYPNIIMKGFFFEIAPFLNFLPGWTYLVWQCMRQKDREKGVSSGAVSGAVGVMAGTAVSAVPGGGLLVAAQALAQRRQSAQSARAEAEPTAQKVSRAPVLSNRVTSDIRPPQAANDNTPRKAYAA